MTTLVTGASGLLGGEVVRVLAAAGQRVRALIRAPRDIPSAAETAIGDLRDPQAIGRALEGCDALVHVAGILLAPSLARAPGLELPRTMIVVSSAAVRTRHRRSAAAYADGERAIRAARPDVLIVRPTMIYGSRRDRNVHHVIDFAARFRWLPLFGDGTARIQPIHYADLALGIAGLSDGPTGATLDAAGPEALTLRETGVTIFGALGLHPRFVRLPLRASAAVAGLFGLRARERILRFAEDRTGDPTAMIRLTGIQPRSFADGVRAQIADLRRQ